MINRLNTLAFSQVFQGTSLICGSFVQIEEMMAKDDFAHIDRVGSRDLYLRLDARGVRFLVSNSSCPLVLELYEKFNIELVKASKAINSLGNKRGKIKETIIKNFY